MPEKDRIFNFIRTPQRTKKPRSHGITMISAGDYWIAVAGMNWTRDLVEWGSEYIDYYKVGHTMMFQPKELVLNKLALLKQHNVAPYVGGNTTEIALSPGAGRTVF